MGMNMEQYITEFTAMNIDGQQLMQLDSEKLKVCEYPRIDMERYKLHCLFRHIFNLQSLFSCFHGFLRDRVLLLKYLEIIQLDEN